MSSALTSETTRFFLYQIRFFQILIVFGLGLIAFLFTKIPHNLWILFSVLAISSTFETGLEVSTSRQRAKGSIAGLVLGVPVIYLCQMNYRLIPLGVLFAACFMWVPNPKNAHIIIIFFILLLFFITSYLFTTPTAEGPFEFAVNRFVCEAVGILICLGADYIIFAKFNYSRKVYSLLQRDVCEMFKELLSRILKSHHEQKDKYALEYEIRKNIDALFFDIHKSKESLLNDFRTDETTKAKMIQFSKLLFQLHGKIFAIYYNAIILNEAQQADAHIADFQETLEHSKNYFI